MFYTMFFILFAALILLCFYFANRRGEHLIGKVVKISTVIFISLSMLNVFLPDLFACSLEINDLSSMTGTKFHSVIRWLNLVCFTVLPIAVFQKNKYFEKIASYFCLPVALINVCCYHQYIKYFTANSNSGLQTVSILSRSFKDFLINAGFRAAIFGITCLSQLIALALLTYQNRERLSIKKGELKNFIIILLGLIYLSLPVYVPQHLVGHVNIMMTRFSPVHIIWILGIVAIIVALYFIFRNKSSDAKYLLVLAMSWSLMIQFSYMFIASCELNIMKLPLQLCNLGSYLALLMLLKKSERIYHFTLIVNVVGAIIAICILDIREDISHLSRLWVVHYIVEHTRVLVIPILCLVLGVFKPITQKSIKDFSVGFTVYYLFVFALGTLSNGVYRLCAGKAYQNFFYANHLFMFDKSIAKELLGFTDPLFDNCVIKIGAFEIYPLVQLSVYLVFMAICLGVYTLIYALTSKHKKQPKFTTSGNLHHTIA